MVCTRYLLRQRTLGEYLLEQSCLPAIKVSVNHCIDELNYQSWKRDIIFYINRVLTKIWEREVRGVVTVIFLCIKRNIYNHVDDVSFLGWIWCHTSAPYNISSMASLMTSSMNSLLKKKFSLMNQQAFENFQIDKLFCLSIWLKKIIHFVLQMFYNNYGSFLWFCYFILQLLQIYYIGRYMFKLSHMYTYHVIVIQRVKIWRSAGLKKNPNWIKIFFS